MRKGQKASEETRLKQRLAKLGKPSNRKGKPSHNKGKAMSQEQKKKIGDANRGRKMSDEARLKMIASKKGKPSKKKGNKYGPLSDELKAKLSEAQKRIGNKPPNLKGHKRTPESVEKGASKRRGVARPQMRGENSPTWQGGITSKNHQIRNSLEYVEWRRAVFKRDDYTCQHCGVRSAKGIKVTLHADHIKPFAYYPELRFDLSNGRTLCKPCHKETDTYMGKAQKFKPPLTDCINIRAFNDLATVGHP